MESGFAPVQIDMSRPPSARMCGYYLGDKDNYIVIGRPRRQC